LEEGSRERMPVAERALDSFLTSLRGDCSGILRNAPKDQSGGGLKNRSSRDILINEATKGLELALTQTKATQVRRFVAKVNDLSWTDGPITQLVHALAAHALAALSIPVPHVCADMKFWVASGYRTLPSRARDMLIGTPPVPEKTLSQLVARGYSIRFPERDILRLLTREEHGASTVRNDVERLENAVRVEETRLLLGAVDRAEALVGR
jgi:hypothetical protein